MLGRSTQPLQPSPETKRKLMARVEADLRAHPAPITPPRASVRERVVLTRAWWSRRSTPQLALGGLALALGVIAALWFLVFNPSSEQRAIAAILSNPHVTAHTLSSTAAAPNAQGKLWVVPNSSEAVLQVSGLQTLPPDKGYEFWLIKGSQPFPAGVFTVDQNGATTFLVRGSENIAAVDKYGITIERREGEQTPKGTLVMQYGF
jgi:anti-sigma-K factor RskA